MVTYNQLYLDARRDLRKAGIEAAALEAREIVCFASGKTREEFIQSQTLYASTDVERHVRELMDRRMAGEPVAYLIGEWEFYGLPLDISRDVLIPRADTEVLAGRAISRAREVGEGVRILDLCAGSGCIGLAIAAAVTNSRVILADWSEAALRICRQNARRNGLTARVSCLKVNALEKPSTALGEFDLIVSNPPYIPSGDIDGLDPSVRLYEPHMALDGGEDGLDFYRSMVKDWGRILRPGGRMLFEVGIGQADAVEKLLAFSGYEDVESLEDTQGILRVVEGRCP